MSHKVIVCCPGDTVTGGPELLHQFAELLNKYGVEASVLYYPFETPFNTPKEYSHYSVKTVSFSDIEKLSNDTLVVIPEVSTRLAKELDKFNVCIWWLSVDNYYPKKGNIFEKKIRNFLSIATGKKLPIFKLKKLINISQSEYANCFLKKNGINPFLITDYLSAAHFSKDIDLTKKKNKIAYNPKKGMNITSYLIKNNEDFEFIAIQNMTSNQVSELLSECKIYIDFGNHPGKDRLPREAAMAGCCIITGRKGSAGNNIDVPIPDKYKLYDNSCLNKNDFRTLVLSIFNDFPNAYSEFESYRKSIINEPEEFSKQVKAFVNNYCS